MTYDTYERFNGSNLFTLCEDYNEKYIKFEADINKLATPSDEISDKLATPQKNTLIYKNDFDDRLKALKQQRSNLQVLGITLLSKIRYLQKIIDLVEDTENFLSVYGPQLQPQKETEMSEIIKKVENYRTTADTFVVSILNDKGTFVNMDTLESMIENLRRTVFKFLAKQQPIFNTIPDDIEKEALQQSIQGLFLVIQDVNNEINKTYQPNTRQKILENVQRMYDGFQKSNNPTLGELKYVQSQLDIYLDDMNQLQEMR